MPKIFNDLIHLFSPDKYNKDFNQNICSGMCFNEAIGVIRLRGLSVKVHGCRATDLYTSLQLQTVIDLDVLIMKGTCAFSLIFIFFGFTGVVDAITCYACSFGDTHKVVDNCARPNASTRTVECAGRCEVRTLIINVNGPLIKY